jgi:hypothetical protein
MRFHLRMQQAQLGDGQLFLGDGLLRGGLFVAAVLGHAAGDGAGDGLGVLQIGAVVHLEPVAPRTALRFAHQGHAAGAVARRHRGQDLVALDMDPVQRIEAPRALVAVGIETGDLGTHLQAVACALDFFRTRQFANGGVDQVEGFAGLQRNLDLPALAVGQRAGIDVSGDQTDAADMRHRAGDDEAQRDQEQKEEKTVRRVAVEDAVPDHQQQDERERPGGGEAEDEEEAGFHGRSRRSGVRWRVVPHRAPVLSTATKPGMRR